MRTSGASTDGPLTYVPFLVAVGILLALLGGPSSTLRDIDSWLRKAVTGVADIVRSAASNL